MSAILELIVPKDQKFFDMLETLATDVEKCISESHELLKNYEKSSKAQHMSRIDSISDECFRQKRLISTELNNTFLTPIDREDILRLAIILQDEAHIAFNVSQKVSLYELKNVPNELPELASKSLECAKEACGIIKSLASKRTIEAHILRIHELEKQADKIRNIAFSRILKKETDDFMALKDIFDGFEMVSEKIEEFADHAEFIVIKYA